MRRRVPVLALGAVLMTLLAAAPAGAAAGDPHPWRAAETVRRVVAAARAYAGALRGRIAAAAPGADRRARAALAAARRAARRGDEAGLAAARGRVRGAVFAGAYAAT